MIETDEVCSHLSLENTVKERGGGRGTSKLSSTSRPKSETQCIRFNNYNGGCKGKCNYLHVRNVVFNLSDDDVTTGSSRPASSHGIDSGFHGLQSQIVDKVLLSNNNPICPTGS